MLLNRDKREESERVSRRLFFIKRDFINNLHAFGRGSCCCCLLGVIWPRKASASVCYLSKLTFVGEHSRSSTKARCHMLTFDLDASC